MRKLEKEATECVETYSQIILREGSRKVKQDELDVKVNRRTFVQFDQLDSKEQLSSTGLVSSQKGFFTIAVMVDKSRVLESKHGKKFIILKLSDLVKYDMSKVRQLIEKEFKNDPGAQKEALKVYNAEGYKTINFLAFGESLTLPFSKIVAGTVLAVLNPRLMRPQQKESTGKAGGAGGPLDTFVKKTPDQEHSFSIESENAIIKIGTSKDFNICAEHSVHPTT